MNLAKGKTVLENWENKHVITNGEYREYGGYNCQGYSKSIYPQNLTIDLEKIEKIRVIRFLIWDNLGSLCKGEKSTREYQYRLLISKDGISWKVLYDTEQSGSNGWQLFKLRVTEEARYVRLHAINNSSKNSKRFHIVEFQVVNKVEGFNENITFQKEIANDQPTNAIEINDDISPATKMTAMIKEINSIIAKHGKTINAEPLKALVDDLNIQVQDISNIENNVEAIRREIIKPVEKQLVDGNKIGSISLWLGIVGGVLGIVSIVLSIYQMMN